MNDTPGSLFKYLPSQFVPNFVDSGELLFSSLSFFRRIEDAQRGDQLEGIHQDRPGGGITITTGRGVRVKGDYSFLNSIDQTKVFAFCMSLERSHELFEAFEADACVEITDVPAFLAKCRRAVRLKPLIARQGLMARRIVYYSSAKPVDEKITDPKNIPFLKERRFCSQHEYRLVIAKRSGFTLLRRIVDPRRHSFGEEIEQSQKDRLMLRVGDLNRISRVHRVKQ